MSKEHPSLSIRPTVSARKEALERDLAKPGWIVILPTGVVLDSSKIEESKCPK